MKDLKIKTQVVHSMSKNSWNVIGVSLGQKYKVAQVPYYHKLESDEAKEIAEYISFCFNNSEKICNQLIDKASDLKHPTSSI